MGPEISLKDAKQYLRRWQAVQRAQIQELRTKSPLEKLAQLNNLLSARALFPAGTKENQQVATVRSRWKQLRKLASHAK
jgi:hypothetical protein